MVSHLGFISSLLVALYSYGVTIHTRRLPAQVSLCINNTHSPFPPLPGAELGLPRSKWKTNQLNDRQVWCEACARVYLSDLMHF